MSGEPDEGEAATAGVGVCAGAAGGDEVLTTVSAAELRGWRLGWLGGAEAVVLPVWLGAAAREESGETVGAEAGVGGGVLVAAAGAAPFGAAGLLAAAAAVAPLMLPGDPLLTAGTVPLPGVPVLGNTVPCCKLP